MNARNEYPKLPDTLAIGCVVLSMLIMAYSLLLKVIPILVFLGLWLAHAFYKKKFILRPTGDLFIAFLVPFLCTYSALWSDYPKETAYAGVGLIGMIACTVIIARIVRIEAFIKGITLGTALVLLVTLASGIYTRDFFSHDTSLTGYFGSKNEVGFFSEVGIYASLIILLSKMKTRDKLAFAVIPLLIGIVCLYKCRSASSVISLVVACSVYFGICLVAKMPKSLRALVLIMGIFTVLTAGVVASAMDTDVFGPVLKIFGKDSTLTGRTYLWSEGIRNGMKRPILGYGYYAFWRPGRPEAEQYWHKFEIPGATGFHFHNLFIQTFVDMGVVGLCFMVFLIFISCYRSISLSLKEGPGLETGLALGLSFLFFVRGFVEVDLFGPFGIGPLLYYSIIPRLAARQPAESAS